MSPLAALFPDGEHRHHLALRRGEPADFFSAQDATGAVLAERARWLASHPGRHAALRPEGAPLLAEFAALFPALPSDLPGLGAALEPDFLLLSPAAEGAFHLRGGVLCFPTAWALAEKIGRPLDFIHAPVPGLNAALAPPLHALLGKLRPGVAYLRDNWGLAATPELNLHPARALPLPAPPVALDRLWLRVEHQALVALPRTGGVAFGIRIALHRLDELAHRDPAAAAGLGRALRSLPADLAAYKRLDAIRAPLAALL